MPAPQIAVRVEHEAAVGVHPAAGEGERQGRSRPAHTDEVGREGRRAPRAILRLWVGFVEQRIERLRVGPRFRAISAIASSVVFGAAPSDGVAALRKRARQSSFATVANAVMSEPSVSRFASVVVCVLLSGSRSTLPHPPVDRIDEVRYIPGGDPQSERIPGDRLAFDEAGGGESRRDGREFVDHDLGRRVFPEHRQEVQRLVVATGLVNSGFAAVATRYKEESLPTDRSMEIAKWPSAPVFTCPRCVGAFALAAQRVTVDCATGPPPAWTCPSMLTAAAAEPASQASKPAAISEATSAGLLFQ